MSGLSGSTTEIRARLLEGLATDVELAEALGVSVRTVYRLELPYVKVANRRLYDVAKAREKLMRNRGGELPPPRPRGRPRKTAAA